MHRRASEKSNARSYVCQDSIRSGPWCGRPSRNPSNAKSLGEQIRDQSPGLSLARPRAIDPVFCSKYKMPLLQQPNCQRTSATSLPPESRPRSVGGQRLNSNTLELGHWPPHRPRRATHSTSHASISETANLTQLAPGVKGRQNSPKNSRKPP